jgi:DNA-binding GntR family transcriptional regulator
VRIYQQVNLVRRQAQWDRMKSIILSPEKISTYNEQHRAIYEALRRRDVLDAVDQINRHLELAHQDLIGAESA